MPKEILGYLQDVSEHARVAWRRRSLRQPERGVDYTDERFDDAARRAVARIHPPRMQLKVVDIVQETPSTKTFRCERSDGRLPPFRPGQYVSLVLDLGGVRTSRPYSMSSAPGTDTLDLTVRDKPGGFVAPYLLSRLAVGDVLESSGPAGHFYHEPLIDSRDVVFLAGGSGITPFMSMIRDTIRRAGDLRIQLLYGCRTPDDVIFGDELGRLAAEHAPSLRYGLVISEPPAGWDGPLGGFLSAQLMREQIGELKGKTFFICGPGVMVDFCLAALSELGVPPYKIRRELFSLPADVTEQPGWPAELSRDATVAVEIEGGPKLLVSVGEPLLCALERNHIVVPARCRSGACSACRTRLLSGKVFMPAGTGLRESDRDHSYIHPCTTYPLEDLKLRL